MLSVENNSKAHEAIKFPSSRNSPPREVSNSAIHVQKDGHLASIPTNAIFN